MKICDFHVHSAFSDDSDASLTSIIEKALSLGIQKICITDHYDIDFPINEENTLAFDLDTTAYIAAVTALKEEYKDRIDIRLGVEMGLMSHIKDKVHDYISSHPSYDFVIGSSHLVDGKDPYFPSFYEGRSEKLSIRAYFEAILENVKVITDYDVYGHLDYIVRYCPSGEAAFSFDDHEEILREILQTIISNGKGIEINTGSLYKGMSYAHPHMEILRLYKNLGGEIITVGSDAHKPEYLCYDFETFARDTLQSLGYKYFCTYKDRKPEFNLL